MGEFEDTDFLVPNRFGIDPSQNALCGRLIPKRRIFAPFWDLPPSDGRAGHPNPKTIWNNTQHPPEQRHGTIILKKTTYSLQCQLLVACACIFDC